VRFYQAAAILLVVFAVISGITQFVLKPLDVSGAPSEFQYVYFGLVYIFSASSVAPLFTMIRNLLGYLENYFEADPEKRSTMKFERAQLAATWVKYEAYINGAAIFIVAFTAGTALAPYAYYMAGTVAFVIDLVRKAFKDAGAARNTSSG
jgi:hypothetical protein